MSMETWNKDKEAVKMMRKTVEDYKKILEKVNNIDNLTMVEVNRDCYFCIDTRIKALRTNKNSCNYCKIKVHFNKDCSGQFTAWYAYWDYVLFWRERFSKAKKLLKAAIAELEQYTKG